MPSTFGKAPLGTHGTVASSEFLSLFWSLFELEYGYALIRNFLRISIFSRSRPRALIRRKLRITRPAPLRTSSAPRHQEWRPRPMPLHRRTPGGRNELGSAWLPMRLAVGVFASMLWLLPRWPPWFDSSAMLEGHR
mgnify:CR=1 FL=1